MTGRSEIFQAHQTLDDGRQSLLDSCRIVLMAPSLPANIGSTVRAMATMGLRDLMVVSPRNPDFGQDADALALAGRAHRRLRDVRSRASLDEALADCQLAVAVSAEGRSHGPAPEYPAVSCAAVLEALRARRLQRVAFVFGTERSGLSVDEMARCQRWLVIPADAGYSSLNLSQAVQIVAFSLRQCLLGTTSGARGSGPATSGGGVGSMTQAIGPAATGCHGASSVEGLTHPSTCGHESAARGPAFKPDPAPLADLAALEGLYRHLAHSLTVLGTLDPARPRRLMPRLRQIFGRAGLNRDEVDLLRGICRDIERRSVVSKHGRADTGSR
ncbi:MAG: TrmH family RNA methyltransferase [Lautropia sp.]|nr:TrmH family RNA methyltransferase [Lautropia sp.]